MLEVVFRVIAGAIVVALVWSAFVSLAKKGQRVLFLIKLVAALLPAVYCIENRFPTSPPMGRLADAGVMGTVTLVVYAVASSMAANSGRISNMRYIGCFVAWLTSLALGVIYVAGALADDLRQGDGQWSPTRLSSLAVYVGVSLLLVILWLFAQRGARKYPVAKQD